MAIGPRAQDLGKIRGWVVAYRISDLITGLFLLLLVVMMIARYGYHSDLAIVDGGVTTLMLNEIPGEDPTANWPAGAVNLSTIILIIHGWLYVAYLIVDFALWRLVRYSFGYFLFVALGGIIPFISFYFEYRVPRDIRRATAHLTEPEGAPA